MTSLLMIQFSLENRSDFPALGQRGVSDYSVRPTPSSPSTAPSRPQSLSDGTGLRQNIDSRTAYTPVGTVVVSGLSVITVVNATKVIWAARVRYRR